MNSKEVYRGDGWPCKERRKCLGLWGRVREQEKMGRRVGHV